MEHFGKSASWYQAIAKGEDDRPVVPDRLRKSSGSETTFERDLTEPAEIEAGVQAGSVAMLLNNHCWSIAAATRRTVKTPCEWN